MSAFVRARGQIMFLAGLILASVVVLWLNGLESVPASDIQPASALVYTPPAQLQAAWQWFEQNRDASTGMLRSSASPAADAGHLLKAQLAAHRLGLINGRELHERVDRTLQTLATRPPQGNAELISALELIAWSYPSNSSAARRELERGRGVPQRPSAPPSTVTATEAAKNATLLVRAAMARKGDQ